jgi:hypothetical protein
MIFSNPPKASELRTWAMSQGFILLANTGDAFSAPETWVDSVGRWRLKIKRPATRAGLHIGSSQERFSCREINPITGELEYYDPASGKFGTRGILGHLSIDIDHPTPSFQRLTP